MARDIPLFILTGFLGSGKSTLLARLIRQPGFADTAVIVNEFGEVGIDSVLVSEGGDDTVVLLESGCICCTLTSSLEDALEALYYRRERGEIPFFSRVVVETTGLADPLPVAASLSGGTFVGRFFRLGGIIATVDVLAAGDQLARFEEARRQVAVADRIVLTKCDLAAPAVCGEAGERLYRIAPRAEQRVAISGAVAPDWLLGDRAGDRPATDAASAGHDHLNAHGFRSVVLRWAGPVSWAAYAALTQAIRGILGAHHLRAKGFLRFEDGETYEIQAVGALFAPPRRSSSGVPDDLVGTVVVIVHDATEQDIARLRHLPGAAWGDEGSDVRPTAREPGPR